MNIRRAVTEAFAKTSPARLADPEEARAFVDTLLSEVERADRAALVFRLRALSRAYSLSLPLPQILRPLRTPQPTRRADWAPQAGKIFRAAEHLEKCLSDRHGRPGNFATRALASAILRGGLLRPKHGRSSGKPSIPTQDFAGRIIWGT